MSVEANGELEKQLSEIVKAGKDGALKAADFIQQQAPDLVSQMLRWNFAESLIWFVIGIVLVIVSICFTRFVIKNWSDWAGSISMMELFGPIICAALWFLSLIIVGCSLDWIKIWIAPKLYIFEWCAAILKK